MTGCECEWCSFLFGVLLFLIIAAITWVWYTYEINISIRRRE